MFRNCKNLEQCKDLLDRIMNFISSDQELVELLKESYCWYTKDLSKKTEKGIIVYPGKYQVLKKGGISSDDDLWKELSDDLDYYINNHEEFKKTRDCIFIRSVQKFAFDNQCITKKQYDTIIVIYYKNNMEVARPE